jgi:polysaccharide chain length determinant protein (PEP-CTERM system associated)
MQPPGEALTVERRPLDLEDYLEIVRRNKGWLAGPAFAGLVVAVVVAFLWPDTYVSEATIQVTPPQVPQQLVPSNVSMEISQRISAMASNILSRPTLINIIQTYNLYPRERARLPMEDIIEQMRTRDIRISPVARLSTAARDRASVFRISFAYPNRFLAQKVAADLAGRFIEENIRTRSSQSVQTTEFLKDQLQQAKKELDEWENKLAEFRVRNSGRLPDQLDRNLNAIRAFETQLAGINDAINRLVQERLMLESQIRITRDQIASLSATPDAPEAPVRRERLAEVERQIVALETALVGMRERYRDDHPDVQRLQRQLEGLRKNRQALLAQEAPATTEQSEARALRPEQLKALRAAEANIARLQSQIEAKNLEIEAKVKEQQQIQRLIKQYQSYIESSPLVERDYAELTRNRDLARARYEDLSKRAAASEMATDLVARGQGDKLELLEPASLPERPAKPNRLLIIGAGLGVGLMLGVFAVGVREMKDTSLKTLKDVRAYTKLAVLATIPLLENDLVLQRKRRLRWLAWSAASLVGLAAMAGSVLYYYSNRS